MTTPVDKDEFDDLELVKRLSALPQPEPSAALDKAILAAVQADLAPRPAAANDPARPDAAAARPNWLHRWRAPLALAAGIAGVLVMLPVWKQDPLNPEAAMQPAPVIEPTLEMVPAAAPADEPKAEKQKAAPLPPPPPPPASGKPAPRSPAPQPVYASAAADSAAPPAAVVVPAPVTVFSPAPAAPAPVAPAASMAAPAPLMAERPAADLLAKPVAATGAIAKRAEPARELAREPAPAPAQTRLPPDAWLQAIDTMLQEGHVQDAKVEWTRFRVVHPTYEVKEPLASRLRGLDSPDR